jgi:hypothetical protein
MGGGSAKSEGSELEKDAGKLAERLRVGRTHGWVVNALTTLSLDPSHNDFDLD